MRIALCQEQRKVRLDLPRLRRLALLLAAKAEARMAGGEPWREVVIHFVDDEGMAPVNRAIIGHEGATDVVTQRYDAIPGEPDGLIGELFIDVEWAVRKAPRRKGWDAGREILLYIAHGCDHLTGADDHLPAERRAMRRRELRWLSSLRE